MKKITGRDGKMNNFIYKDVYIEKILKELTN